MLSDVWLINSTMPLYPEPASWMSEPVDLGAQGSTLCSFHIIWRDVAITWFLWASNCHTTVADTAPPWIDVTAEYRLVDPGWVDPVLGDPLSAWRVAFRNVGMRYVRLGFSASNWGGANKRLQVSLYRDAMVIP